jgi:PAS domain S-box-containing protein
MPSLSTQNNVFKNSSIADELYQQLLASPEKFKFYLDSFPGVVFRANLNPPKGEILFISKNIESLTGYKHKLFLSGALSFKDIINPSEYDDVVNQFRSVSMHSDFFKVEYHIVHKTGRKIQVQSAGTIVRSETGEPLLVNGTLLEITSKSALEKDLSRVIGINENLINSSPNIIFAKDKAGAYRMANKALTSILGLELDEIIGKTDVDLVNDKKRIANYKEQDDYVIKTGKVWEGIPTFVKSFGKQGWYKTIKSPIKNNHGEIEGVLGIVTDVTALMQSQRTINDQRRLFQTVFNSGTDFMAVYKYDKGEFKYVSYNKPYVALLKKLGLKKDINEKVLGGQKIFELALKENLIQHNQVVAYTERLNEVLESGEVIQYTDFLSVPNQNKSIYIDSELSPILDVNRSVKYIVYRGHEFTELMDFNRQLQEREELLASINRNIRDGIYRTTIDDGFCYVNEAMCSLFGFTQQEFKEIHPNHLYHNVNDRKSIVQELLSNGHFKDKEFLFKRKDNTVFWGLLSCSMTLEADGRKVIDGIVVDVTEKRKTRENLRRTNGKLRKINSELDHLVYRTSHDLRSPIASVMGLIELLKLEGLSDSSAQYIALMEDQLFKLDRVILDIINIRKIAKTGLQKQAIDFRELLVETFDSIKFLDQFDALEKTIDISQEGPFIQDENNIKILLNNLLSNAVKYADRTKSINKLHVAINITSKNCRLQIEDNGIGISEESLPKVFNMFYRGTSKNQGTGLGLFIVKEALDKLRGTIQVESKDGEWSRFILEIPNLN